MTTCTSNIDATVEELTRLFGYTEEQEWKLRRDLTRVRNEMEAKMAPHKHMWEPLAVGDTVRIEQDGAFRLYKVTAAIHDEFFLELVV